MRFVQGASPYNAGDLAGFPDAAADRYIARGFAVEHVPETDAAEDEVARQVGDVSGDPAEDVAEVDPFIDEWLQGSSVEEALEHIESLQQSGEDVDIAAYLRAESEGKARKTLIEGLQALLEASDHDKAE